MSADSKLRALLSLNQGEYDSFLEVFSAHIKKKLSPVTLKGQLRLFKTYDEPINSSLHGSKSKLDFILTYLKENPNQSYHGRLFNMSQSKVNEWISYLLPVLEQSLKKLKFMPQTGYSFKETTLETDCLLVDVIEREVPRNVDYENQKETYSGKKKLHTMKNLAITDHQDYILFLSESYDGSIHNKTIWDQIQFEFKELNLLEDLGFAGIEKEHPNAILSYKKPKNKKITPLQKEINRAIGSVRVRIEHAFSGVKRLKIVRNKIRLKPYQVRDRVFKIAAALHNLRLTFRATQNFS